MPCRVWAYTEGGRVVEASVIVCGDADTATPPAYFYVPEPPVWALEVAGLIAIVAIKAASSIKGKKP